MNAPPLSYSAELKRKAIHLPALAMPIGLLLLGRESAFWILVPLAVLILVADVGRHRIAWIHRAVVRLFGSVMRPEELPRLGGKLVLNGATWMIVSATLCAVLYTEPIAAAALIMLILGDAAAAIIGRRFGRHSLPFSDKSWEGTAAFFIVAVVASLALAMPDLMNGMARQPLSFTQIGLGALVAAFAEALPIPLDDNLRVPVLAGLMMTFV